MKNPLWNNDTPVSTVILVGFLLVALLFGTNPCFSSESVPTVTVTIDVTDTAQTIRNIGSSGCWYSENIGRYWPQAKKQRIAELLFSRELDETGTPKGIGLSAWRFNIGGGTAEQGEQSGIRDSCHRVECFLNADGSYDWSKQAGYRWFVQKAQEYGVQDLIAFSNSPPVHFTQNGLGFKTVKDYRSNLRPDKIQAFADFLVEVLQQFENQGIHFDYLSPINEPQWDWSYEPGRAKQEGSPWRNDEIYPLVQTLDQTLRTHSLTTKILIPEAAQLDFLARAEGRPENLFKSQQVQAFWGSDSPCYVGNLTTVAPFVAGHSYFADKNDSQLISTRHYLAQAIQQQSNRLEYWQSEYCLLGDGFREGKGWRVTEMDHALFLAKVIHHDFVIGGATAWHYWNAYEPGPARCPQYYLIALSPQPGGKDGSFTPTKALWALGHYSRFIRPGMKRLRIQRSDNLTDMQAAQQLMISAFFGVNTAQTVVVVINYQQSDKLLNIKDENLSTSSGLGRGLLYLTTSDPGIHMKVSPVDTEEHLIQCPARSLITILFSHS